MFKLLWAGPSSACFELENKAPYRSPEPYSVWLDGEERLRGETNVFSLFGLFPGKTYEVELRMGGASGKLRFTTRTEPCALDVREFGAAGDGETDDTAAIQRAILLLPAGGRLVFPRGVYRTGALFLRSHMTLELTEGAVLLGLTEKSAYPVLPAAVPDRNGGEAMNPGTFEGLDRDMYAALLTAYYAEDITLVGPGRVDGNAQNGTWWRDFKQDPVARPRLCFLNRCRGVVLHGIEAANSASWQLHPYQSEEISFYDVSVSAPKDSPNTDALDPESCDRVAIVGCRFSVGDDCIAVKSGKLDKALSGTGRPATNHTIRNCLMAFGHGAVVLGSEISCGVRDLSVTQCEFRQTDRGLRIKTRRGRGEQCQIEGVTFENIRMEGVLTPIVINCHYRCVDPDGDSDYVQSREPQPVDVRTPRLGDFVFRNMDCRGTEVAGCFIDGLPERPIGSVTLEHIRMDYKPDAKPGVPSMYTNAPQRCRMGLYFNQVGAVTLRDVTLSGADGDEVILSGVGSFRREEY